MNIVQRVTRTKCASIRTATAPCTSCWPSLETRCKLSDSVHQTPSVSPVQLPNSARLNNSHGATVIGGGVTGGILAVGLLLLMLWKALVVTKDRIEYTRFKRERLQARWNRVRSPCCWLRLYGLVRWCAPDLEFKTYFDSWPILVKVIFIPSEQVSSSNQVLRVHLQSVKSRQ